MSEEQQPVLTFEGVEYPISDLSVEAKAQLESLHYAEVEMKRLQVQLAMITTARNAYTQALASALPKVAKKAKTKAAAKKKKAVANA